MKEEEQEKTAKLNRVLQEYIDQVRIYLWFPIVGMSADTLFNLDKGTGYRPTPSRERPCECSGRECIDARDVDSKGPRDRDSRGPPHRMYTRSRSAEDDLGKCAAHGSQSAPLDLTLLVTSIPQSVSATSVPGDDATMSASPDKEISVSVSVRSLIRCSLSSV